MTRVASRSLFLILAVGSVFADEVERAEPAMPDEVLDLEFLEYLGSWEGSDADWLIVSATEEDVPPPPPPSAQEEEDARED